MEIYFSEEVPVTEETAAVMRKAAEEAARREGLDPEALAVSVSFVDLEEIHQLNREYRNVDRPTDVLSFPMYESIEEILRDSEMLGEAEIGDVVICLDKVHQQAAEFGHSRERETIYLFVHSILHLLGYDHMEEDEKRIMRSREEEIMDYLGIPRSPVSEA